MAMYCETGSDCKPARPIIIGAVVGAAVGVVIEYFVRNGQRSSWKPGPDPAAKVVLEGKAQSCHPGTPVRLVGVRNVNVAAFRASKVPSIIAHLKAMDTTSASDATSMARMDSLSRQTDRLVNSSVALSRTISDSTGRFKLSIPATDSVVVYGIGNDEDEPFEQAYATISGRASRSFVLDMAHGGCGQ
jgi:hypothetical protein